MDPIANLREQREIAGRILVGEHEPADYVRMAAELAELVVALDEWRTNGGFDPYEPTPHLGAISIRADHGEVIADAIIEGDKSRGIGGSLAGALEDLLASIDAAATKRAMGEED